MTRKRWVPEIKAITIPPQFWASLTPAECSQMLLDEGLNAALCKRLWAMLGRVDRAPNYQRVYFDRVEFEAWLAKIAPKEAP